MPDPNACSDYPSRTRCYRTSPRDAPAPEAHTRVSGSSRRGGCDTFAPPDAVLNKRRAERRAPRDGGRRRSCGGRRLRPPLPLRPRGRPLGVTPADSPLPTLPQRQHSGAALVHFAADSSPVRVKFAHLAVKCAHPPIRCRRPLLRHHPLPLPRVISPVFSHHFRHRIRSPKLASDLPGTSAPIPRQNRGLGSTVTGLAALNHAATAAAETALLTCCGCRQWARRMAAHRPYPDLGALLAAADQAAYDLAAGDLAEALACEEPLPLPQGGGLAAHTALRVGLAEYQRRFGHAFVICLDAVHPDEHLDHVLAGLRLRLGNTPEEERAVAADELRALARGRLAQLARPCPPVGPHPGGPHH
ncbi:2-oxo-4-hydroxy-4-carboxy-5-ureidoimidazoline decarboxylase [Streptantibioticus ferralitis]